MPNDSLDLVFGSPPYEDARTYGIDFNLKGQNWVDWMVEIYEESIRVSKGLVAFVVQGRTKKFKWSCTPALLIADLHRAGFNVRNPVLYQRLGIPGSGGPDWLRSCYEWIVCVSKPGKLLWSDNTAMGHASGKCGNPTHRKQNGKRVSNQFKKPKRTNPGNIIECGANTNFGKGNENEAPFPLKLAEFFVKSFCSPNGTTLDPFCGSSTTGHACVRNERNYIGIDCRQSQIKLSRKRLVAAKKELK